MKQASLIWLILGIAGLAILAGCAKTQIAQTPYTEIQGIWKLKQSATDDNNDGLLEQDELTNVSPGYTEYLVFNASTGTQKITVNDTTNVYNFTWTLTSGDSILVRMEEGDSLVSDIQTLDRTDLLLRNHTTPVLSWGLYSRQ